MSKTALFFGATGEVGKHALKAALENAEIGQVHTMGRSESSVSHPKLKHTVVSFDGLLARDAEQVKVVKAIKADIVIVTLGTTKANAGSAENFQKIDRDYVLAAAEASHSSEKPQTLVYCSSGGASASSRFLYMRTKGETEQGLARLFPDSSVIFRPGALIVPGGRAENRTLEKISVGILGRLNPLLGGTIAIDTPVLGRAIVNAGVLGIKGLSDEGRGKKEDLGSSLTSWVLNNAEAFHLGKTSSS